MKRIVLTSLFIVFTLSFFAQQINPLLVESELEQQQQWVDSIYGNMSLQEKVGQLFMVDLFSSDPQSKIDRVENLIKDYYIGGIIFSKGGPVRQATINNRFQETSQGCGIVMYV